MSIRPMATQRPAAPPIIKITPMTCKSTFLSVQVTAKRRIAPMMISAALPPIVTSAFPPGHATRRRVAGSPRPEPAEVHAGPDGQVYSLDYGRRRTGSTSPAAGEPLQTVSAPPGLHPGVPGLRNPLLRGRKAGHVRIRSPSTLPSPAVYRRPWPGIHPVRARRQGGSLSDCELACRRGAPATGGHRCPRRQASKHSRGRELGGAGVGWWRERGAGWVSAERCPARRGRTGRTRAAACRGRALALPPAGAPQRASRERWPAAPARLARPGRDPADRAGLYPRAGLRARGLDRQPGL